MKKLAKLVLFQGEQKEKIIIIETEILFDSLEFRWSQNNNNKVCSLLLRKAIIIVTILVWCVNCAVTGKLAVIVMLETCWEASSLCHVRNNSSFWRRVYSGRMQLQAQMRGDEMICNNSGVLHIDG